MAVHEEFVQAEILTGQTMVRLAYTQARSGDSAGAHRAIDNAKLALVTAKRFLPLITVSAQSAKELGNGIDELERTINHFEQDYAGPGEHR